MIPLIERYIYEHISEWPIKFQQPLSLSAMVRYSKEDDGLVDRFWIGQVIFWFTGSASHPFLVTKIMDSSVGFELVKKVETIQKEVNENIGYNLFPQIFDLAELSGKIILFQEAVQGPNFEIALSRAIYGPECSLSLMSRVIQSQFKEMGEAFKRLQGIKTSDKPLRWGNWAYRLGQDFKNNCDFDTGCLTDAHLNEMRKAIDSLPMYSHMMLIEDHVANYFPGLRGVDQIDPYLEEMISQWPGTIGAFRFIIAFFRAGPIVNIFNNWLDAIAVAIVDRDGETIFGPPVRSMLKQVGLNLEQTNVIWALVMVTYFIRVQRELGFHEKNVFVINRLKADFEQQTKKLVEIQERLRKNKRLDFTPFILTKERILEQMPLSNEELPHLIEEGYKRFNIVHYRNKFYAMAQVLGPLDLTQTKESTISEYQKHNLCFVADSVNTVKELIDQFKRIEALEKELTESSIWFRVAKRINRLKGGVLRRKMKKGK